MTPPKFSMAPPKQIAEKRTKAGSPTPDSLEPLLQDMRPPGAPTTQTAPDNRPRLSLNDLATQHELFEHTKPFQCETCGAYFKHLQEARLDDGRRSGLKPCPLRSKQNEHENNDQSDEDDDEDEELELANPEDESLMDPLFRLQDLRGKMRTMAWFDSGREAVKTRGVEQKKEDAISQNAELQAELQAVKEHADNTCADLHMRVAEIEKRRDDALRQNAELQAQLQVIQQNADNTRTDLCMRLEGVLSDTANARADLSLARADGDQARTDRDRVRQELSSAQQKIASLSQELANIDSARPRKRSHAPSTITNNIPASTNGFPPPVARTAEEQQWEALHRMQRPQPADHPLTIAHFLQHNEDTTFKGIPTSGPKWVIDMRDVLAVPGEYSKLLSRTNKQVGPVASLTPCVFGEKPGNKSLPGFPSRFAREGPGFVYVHFRVKIGVAVDVPRRQRGYRKCDVLQSHFWLWSFLVVAHNHFLPRVAGFVLVVDTYLLSVHKSNAKLEQSVHTRSNVYVTSPVSLNTPPARAAPHG
ncbi:hypothetical protein B0H16DRAFT_1462056 [Mycena metata]|uniref:Uncharacterized protein n=1 Tax=Mycena metata TaxID=1033252 RepID=A0AAD7IPB1_9AGAR|nr:hypothetical protein B0H16DRAFT_1462056 [Mycena metata]